MIKDSLSVLEESLVKKNNLLDKLQTVLDKQAQMLLVDSMELEEFDSCMEMQDKLVEELIQMDKEFDGLFERIQKELANNRERYVTEIEKLQQFNQQILDKSAAIIEQEQRNKDMLTTYFQNEKKNFGAGRRSSKAAYDYYKNMSRLSVVPPHFMDKKK